MKKFKVMTNVDMTYLVEAKDHDEARDIVITGEIDVWDSEILDDDVREISKEDYKKWRSWDSVGFGKMKSSKLYELLFRLSEVVDGEEAL